jgi:hypothetical protein
MPDKVYGPYSFAKAIAQQIYFLRHGGRQQESPHIIISITGNIRRDDLMLACKFLGKTAPLMARAQRAMERYHGAGEA